MAGFVVLILIPAFSVGFVIYAKDYTFWGYTFPFVSIALAGLYDAYGRYDGTSQRIAKLVIRGVLDFLAIFFAAFSIGLDSAILPYIAPLLFLLCGLLLIVEIYNRVKYAISISPWLTL